MLRNLSKLSCCNWRMYDIKFEVFYELVSWVVNTTHAYSLGCTATPYFKFFSMTWACNGVYKCHVNTHIWYWKPVKGVIYIYIYILWKNWKIKKVINFDFVCHVLRAPARRSTKNHIYILYPKACADEVTDRYLNTPNLHFQIAFTNSKLHSKPWAC